MNSDRKTVPVRVSLGLEMGELELCIMATPERR